MTIDDFTKILDECGFEPAHSPLVLKNVELKHE